MSDFEYDNKEFILIKFIKFLLFLENWLTHLKIPGFYIFLQNFGFKFLKANYLKISNFFLKKFGIIFFLIFTSQLKFFYFIFIKYFLFFWEIFYLQTNNIQTI
jgi:hypothetical protein